MNQTAALLRAIRLGDSEGTRQFLLAQPSLASARDDDGVSAIVLALTHGHVDVAYLLLEYGATPDLFDSAALGRADRIRQLGERSGVNLDAYSGDGWQAIHLAAMGGHSAAVQALLGLGASATGQADNSTGITALHAAVEVGNWDSVLALLAGGADPVALAHDGSTPLKRALVSGRTDLVELLVAHLRTRGGDEHLAAVRSLGQG